LHRRGGTGSGGSKTAKEKGWNGESGEKVSLASWRHATTKECQEEAIP